MHPALTPAVLARLRAPRPYPAVSLVMPTHRREPDNAQDPVRLRNLLAEAKERLRADPAVTRERRADVEEQLDRAHTEVDLAHVEDGLAIFAAPGEHHVWYLGRTAPERVVLADTFLTRNLVAAREAERPYWVMAVSANRVSLWNGGPERVTEVYKGGFPLTRSLTAQDVEREERIGDVPSTFTDEATRQFLRGADEAMRHVLAAAPRPLYVAGEAAALSLLDDAGTVARDASRVPHGGLADGPADVVWQAVRPFRAVHQEAEIGALLQELDKARGRRDFAAGVDEVWQSALGGRVGTLAVEENYRTTVRDDGEHLVPAESGDLDAREDLVDEIVERSLDTDAKVRFVPDGTLAEQNHIAAVLRY
ncbi:chemotaxis protein [Streptomyces sp. NPDC058001]|uniref:baeRF3 domain-containing protein n=1 Tax=Streptomyces sp. NPDC058001 TaxID=3346300 RepID=UPI0036EB8389